MLFGLLFVFIALRAVSQPITITAKGPTVFCDGDSVALMASPGYLSYYWKTGSTDQTILVRNAGYYWVRGIDQNGNTVQSDSILVTIIPSPSAPQIHGDSNMLTCSSEASYQWKLNDVVIPGQTNQTIDITKLGTGNYSVEVANQNGCKRLSREYLNAIEIKALGGTSFCSGDSILLKASDGYQKYLWSNGSSNIYLTVKTGGIYTVNGINLFGDTIPAAPVTITVFPTPPKPTITKVSWMLLSSDALAYQWYKNGAELFGENKRLVDVTSHGFGWYKVLITDTNGCRNMSDSIEAFGVIGSVIDVYDNALGIYPNPITNDLHIKVQSENLSWDMVKITNNIGEDILGISLEDKNAPSHIDVSTLSNGIYYLQLHSRNKVLTKQFVIVR